MCRLISEAVDHLNNAAHKPPIPLLMTEIQLSVLELNIAIACLDRLRRSGLPLDLLLSAAALYSFRRVTRSSSRPRKSRAVTPKSVSRIPAVVLGIAKLHESRVLNGQRSARREKPKVSVLASEPETTCLAG